MNWAIIAYNHGYTLAMQNHAKRAGWHGARYEDFCRGYKDGTARRLEEERLKHVERMSERDPFEDGFFDALQGHNEWHPSWGRCSDFQFRKYKKGYDAGYAQRRKKEMMLQSPKIEITTGRKEPVTLFRDVSPGYYEMFVGTKADAWVPVIVTKTPSQNNLAVSLNNPAVHYFASNYGLQPIRIPESPLEIKVTF